VLSRKSPAKGPGRLQLRGNTGQTALEGCCIPARQSDHMVRKRPERREYKIEESLDWETSAFASNRTCGRARSPWRLIRWTKRCGCQSTLLAPPCHVVREDHGQIIHVIALPWYHRRDYTALLMLVSDPQTCRRLTTHG